MVHKPKQEQSTHYTNMAKIPTMTPAATPATLELADDTLCIGVGPEDARVVGAAMVVFAGPAEDVVKGVTGEVAEEVTDLVAEGVVELVDVVTSDLSASGRLLTSPAL